MDLDLLINIVYQYPSIWDKRLKSNRNRSITDECWAEISNTVKEDENMMRRKWKYLRDQYCVELGKTQACNVESKWRYFKMLEFLKVCVTPRVSPRWPERVSGRPEQDAQSSASDEAASPMPRKRKLEQEKTQHQSVLEETHEERYVTKEEDEHLHFFKSLLPHVKRIPTSRLLSFRSRIQSLVEEFAYGSAVSMEFGTQSPRPIKTSPRSDSETSDQIHF